MIPESIAHPLRSLYRQLVPRRIRRKAAEAAKAVVALAGAAVLIVAQVAPEWSDETQAIVTAAIGILTTLGVYSVRNQG